MSIIELHDPRSNFDLDNKLKLGFLEKLGELGNLGKIEHLTLVMLIMTFMRLVDYWN